MALSSDLISQFVKITNDKKEVPKETTVYGTTVDYNGKTYVQMDGSDLLTPVSTTTDLKPGERVTVMIKNHTATVTGNISSPSASGKELRDAVDTISEFEIIIAKKADVEALNAEKARIDTLTADNVTIKESLTANSADIDKLQASTLTITENLTATEANITKLQTEKIDTIAADAKFATIENLEATDADIHNLEVTYGNFANATADQFAALRAEIEKLEAGEITVEQLKATFATIEQLNAEKARIDDLEAEVADIDTLIFGSATGSTIQTSFANAVIAQLGNAQIKSAMIDSVNASKVNTGEIDTNKVSVGSGNLLISDETIQISDDTRVRVQVGKDASNDYSINVWDESGNLMFSKGGITDAAIKTAIIRNDMVSDTANIAAHKLDIDSLFEEINNSEKTIKSTRIYLDDEGQTLDVAFESMTTDIENLQNGVSSQGTQISAMQGQIAARIWQQDIDTAKGEMSTQYSSLSQSLNNFQTTVGNTYATKEEIGDISVGGRNLFGFNKGVQIYDLGQSAYAKGTFNRDIRGFQTNVVSDTPSPVIITRISKLGFNGIGGEDFTFSAKIYSNVDDIKLSLDICDSGDKAFIVGTTPQKISFSATPSLHYNSTSTYNGFLDVSVGSGAVIPADTVIYFEDVKIERGNIATDWTPAPEDLASYTDIQSVETKITQTESSLEASVRSVQESVNGVIVGGRNLVLNTGTYLNIPISDEPVSMSRGTSYQYADWVKQDNKQFLLDIENQYLLFSYDVYVPTIYKDDTLSLNRVGIYITVKFTHKETGNVVHWYGPHSSAIMGQGNTIGKSHYNTSNSLIAVNDNSTADNPDSFVGHYCGYCDMSVNSNTTIIKNFYTNPDDFDVEINALTVDIRGFTTGGYVKNIKMEVGNKPTAWSPAPEDFQNGINNLESRVSVNETNISLLSDGITANVTAINNLGSRTSTLEQTSTGLTTRVSKVESNISEISIGGRNLIENSNFLYERTKDATSIENYGRNIVSGYDLQSLIGNMITFSFYRHAPGNRDVSISSDVGMQNRFGMHGTVKWTDSTGANTDIIVTYPFTEHLGTSNSNSRVSMSGYLNPPSGYDTLHSVSISIQLYAKPASDNDETWLLGYPKLEIGSKATDWTPAPEDMATSDELTSVQSTIDLTETRMTTAETLIQQLSDCISMMVTDGDGQSLMTQTDDGWTFSTGDIQDKVNATSENLDSLINEVGNIDSAVGILQQAVDDLGVLSEYVKITTYEDEPCIELGETDSDFKLLITNTRIMFMEGTGVPAYITNQALHIKKAVVEQELQQGEFIWKARSNGNLGLIWKGATN